MNIDMEQENRNEIGRIKQDVNNVQLQLQSLTNSVTGLASHLEKRDALQEKKDAEQMRREEQREKAQHDRDAVLFRKIDEAKEGSRPNIGMWAIWLGFVIAVIFPIMGGWYWMQASANEERSNSIIMRADLSDKLQQYEMDENRKIIDRMKDQRDAQLNRDLDELQARRNGIIK